jgi:uncharacterized protein
VGVECHVRQLPTPWGPIMTDATVSTIRPVVNGVFTLPPYDGNPPHLLGGECDAGHGPFFPRPTYCPRCLGPVHEADLGNYGTIYGYTVVRTRPPLGFPQPYSVGFVDLEDAALRVFCLLDPSCIQDLAIGKRVRLRVEPFGDDGAGEPLLRPIFTLAEEGR